MTYISSSAQHGTPSSFCSVKDTSLQNPPLVNQRAGWVYRWHLGLGGRRGLSGTHSALDLCGLPHPKSSTCQLSGNCFKFQVFHQQGHLVRRYSASQGEGGRHMMVTQEEKGGGMEEPTVMVSNEEELPDPHDDCINIRRHPFLAKPEAISMLK